MALYKRLGSIFGLPGIAAAVAAISLATATPAKAGGDVRVYLGFPSALGIVVDRGHYHKPPAHWHAPRYKKHYYQKRPVEHWRRHAPKHHWRDHGRHDRRWAKHDRRDDRHRGGRRGHHRR